MNQDIVTADLSGFMYVELTEAIELLKAYREQRADFMGEGLTLNFNKNSGYVFLCDEDYNVAMLNGDKIEQWFNCPQCGHEGFKEDMQHGEDNKDCQEYLKEIGVKGGKQ